MRMGHMSCAWALAQAQPPKTRGPWAGQRAIWGWPGWGPMAHDVSMGMSTYVNFTGSIIGLSGSCTGVTGSCTGPCGLGHGYAHGHGPIHGHGQGKGIIEHMAKGAVHQLHRPALWAHLFIPSAIAMPGPAPGRAWAGAGRPVILRLLRL